MRKPWKQFVHLQRKRSDDMPTGPRAMDLDGSPKTFPPFCVHLGRTEGSRRSQVDRDGFQGRDGMGRD